MRDDWGRRFRALLSITLGIPLRELDERVDAQDFAEYEALFRICPFGPQGDDLRMGYTMAGHAAIHGSRATGMRFWDPQWGLGEKRSVEIDASVSEYKARAGLRAAGIGFYEVPAEG